MFDIGFWELALIGVVALVVIGPERLPGVARTAGLWVGKARNFIASVKQDIDVELKAEELKEFVKKQGDMPELQELIDESRTLSENNEYVVKAVPSANSKETETTPEGNSDKVSSEGVPESSPDKVPHAKDKTQQESPK